MAPVRRFRPRHRLSQPSWPNNVALGRRQTRHTAAQPTISQHEKAIGKFFYRQPDLLLTPFQGLSDVSLVQYENLFEQRVEQFREWVTLKYLQKRISVGVRDELLAYSNERKFCERPSTESLSKYACEALKLSERDLGTDRYWAKRTASMYGPWGRFDKRPKGYGLAGPGYVGEDSESSVADSEKWEGSMIGEPSPKGHGEKEVADLDIDMAE